MEKSFRKFGKTGGIIFAICLMVLGILMLIFPVGSLVVSTWLFVAGLGVYGIFNIISYSQTPADKRNGWQIASGIITLILFVLMLPVYGEIKFFANLDTIMFMLAFYSIAGGVTSLTVSSAVAEAGGSKGFAIFSGILSIALGIFMICCPFIAGLAEIYVLAIWLVVIAVSLLCESIAKPKEQ